MSRVIRFGPFDVDLSTGELRKHGVKVPIREQAFEILTMMLKNRGEVVSRTQLRALLWPHDVFVDFDNNINTAVTHLRKALGDRADRPTYVETLPRRGYRFAARAFADSPQERTVRRPRPRLAVLPVLNLSGAKGDERLCVGLADELTTQVAAIASNRIGVVAHARIASKGLRGDAAGEIARALDLDYLVEGSLQHDGRTARIHLQLVRVEDDTDLWAKSYGSSAEFLTFQAHVARDAARRIGDALSPARND